MSSNIKVAIRVRPLISREKNEKLNEQWEISENAIYPIDLTTGKRNADAYHFDHIFGSTCCNADIYNTVVHPVVDKAMNGFNGTVFAYGQTSSGKTYTMMGNAKEDGLISIAVQNVFFAIEQSINRKFLLRVSYMEIYNEKIYDLLDIKNTVKISEDFTGSVVVNVKEEVTDCAERIYDIMKKGDKVRRIGETNMNEKSSRSHTIFRIIIESSDINDTGVVNVAHLNLVDLAGSERATLTKATGQRLKEGAHINKSLSTLSLVMKQLSESQDFINFRDSKLTRILQSSLGGNALTAIIAAVTPAALEETHSTLAFASRAKTIKNKPLINEVMTDEALINKYVREINRLKKENINLQGSLQEAQKIAVLERHILSSKNTHSNISNKNRRKTWSAPQDTRALPVIYETDVLRLSDQLSTDSLQTIESETCPFDEYSSDGDRSTPSSERRLPPWATASITSSSTPSITPSGSEISLVPSEPKSTSSNTSLNPPEESVKWLVQSTDTPKSVLRKRAEYYEHEFNSLKELTTQEKLLLTTEYSSDIDLLNSELDIIKNELTCEKNLRKEHESSIAEVQRKYNELTKINQKLQRENEIKNDSEFLVDMYKEKYKKREKELLDSLEEARKMLKSKTNTNNTDNEKICGFLNQFKNQSNILKFELESNQPITSIQNVFAELKKLNDEMLSKPADCSEEIQDFLNVFKFIFDVFSSVLLDDTLLIDLERQKQQLQNREKTYELLVSKQDEEIKHLSENILQYMTELESHKSELAKYKDQVKSEISFQTDLDFSVSLNDSQNLTCCILSDNGSTIKTESTVKSDQTIKSEEDLSSTLNKTETTIKSDQIIQTEENFSSLIKEKNKEIEDLSDKIMEYIDQLTAVEEELNKVKSVSKLEQLIQTDILMQNDIIYKQCEFDEMERAWNAKINSYEAQLSNYQSEIDEKTKIIDSLENGVADLNVSNYVQQIKDLEEEVKLLKDLLDNEKNGKSKNDSQNINEIYKKQTLDISLQTVSESSTEKTNQRIQTEEDILLKSKVKEIEDLSEKLMEYLDLVSALEKDIEKLNLKHKENLDSKNKEIEQLSSSIDNYISQLSSAEEKVKSREDLIKSQNEDIKELSSNIMNYVDQLSSSEKKIETFKDQISSKDKEIEELSSNIFYYKDQLSSTEDTIKVLKDQISSKTKEIDTLSSKVDDYARQLSSAEEMINNHDLSYDKKNNKFDEELKVRDDQIEYKNKEIEDLSSKLNDIIYKKCEFDEMERAWNAKITSYEAQLSNYQSEIDEKTKIIDSLENGVVANGHFEDLNVSNYVQQIKDLEEEVKLLKYLLENEKNGKSKNDSQNINEIYKKQTLDISLQTVSESSTEKTNQSIQTEEDILLQSKVKEIEDLSDKLMEYLDLVSTLEKDIEKLNLKHKENLDSKNKEIEQLSSSIDNYISQLSSAEEKIKSREDLIKSQNEDIKELSSNIMNYVDQLSSSEKKIETFKDQISSKDKEIEELSSNIFYYKDQLSSTEDTIKVLKDQISSKTKEIDTLSSKVDDYARQLSSAEEMINNHDLSYDKKNNKFDEELKVRDDQIDYKNKAIEDLSSKLKDYKEELSFVEEKLNSYKQNYVLLEEQLKSKNKEIEELSCNILDYMTQLSDVNTQKDLIESKNSEIKELAEYVSLYSNQISSKDKQLNDYESHIEKSQNTISLKNDEINALTKQLNELLNTISQQKDDVYKLRSELNIKEEIVIHKENEIKNLNEVINQYTQQFENMKHDLSNSVAKEWNSKLQSEQNKSVEYLNRVNSLEKQIMLFTQQANEMKLEYESIHNSNLQYSTANENLQKQICALKGHISHQECTIKQDKTYINQLEEDKKRLLQNITLMRNTSMNDIQTLTEKLIEKTKYIENLQKELVNLQQIVQNNDSNITEMTKLKKKNEDYKKIVEQVTEKANNKISQCSVMLLQFKQDIELLKIQNHQEKESNQKLQTQIDVLKQELEQRTNGVSGGEILKFQTKMNELEDKNKKLVNVIEDYQEQIHKKVHELNQCRKNIECVKRENADLQHIKKDLNNTLCETEEQLKSSRANVELLEKEKENYRNSCRILEERVADLDFKVYEFKNKEKEKIKKIKRQSLHDSSRSLSSDEHINIIDENQEHRRQSFEPRGTNELNSENRRLPLSGKLVDEQRQNSIKVQIEYEKLRKKYDQLSELCRIRKQKIEELEKQLQM